MSQVFVAGAAVPISLKLRDFYPDDQNPDWVDLTLVSTSRIWFRKGKAGTPVSADATVQTVDTVDVLQVSAEDAAATVTSEGTWFAQAEADLRGDQVMVPSEVISFQVKPTMIVADSSS